MLPTAKSLSTQSPSNSAFPGNLETVTETGNSPSIISSKATDVESDDIGPHNLDGTAARGAVSATKRISLAHSTGEPTLSSSRPSSTATRSSLNRQAWSHASRYASRGNYYSGGLATGSDISTEPGRPPSSASRTHVPSLASHAFFRPLSSQRLQAQRSGRPSPTHYAPAKENVPFREMESGSGSKPNQNKNSSGLQDSERAQPPSRGTEWTEVHGQEMTTASATPGGNDTSTSTAGSVRPLNHSSLAPSEPARTFFRSASEFASPLQKSADSFRSSFLLPNRPTVPVDGQSVGREKLASADSTPHIGAYDKPRGTTVASERNHHYFLGNTVFCFGGRLQNARDRPISIATGILVVLPSALFFAFSAPWLWFHVSPAIPITFAYLFLICISSFTHASVSDPGILPRNVQIFPPSNDADDPLTLGPPTTDWTLIKSTASPSSAMEVPIKYCKTCNIWRPPRGHHCRVCDNCIETQDHHCVWLNNCIGRRNYRFFAGFVSSCTLLGLFLLGASLAHVLLYRSMEGLAFRESVNHLRVPFAMVLYGALATPYPASLWGYHLFLMARGETTREYLNSHKFLKRDRHRPFTQGNFLKNWIAVLNRPRPPTYLQFKRRYESGDQRFGSKKVHQSIEKEKKLQMGDVEMRNFSDAVPSFRGPSTRAGNLRNN